MEDPREDRSLARDEVEKDPGLIFYFDDSQIIHQCL